jgi:hypothetical protein
MAVAGEFLLGSGAAACRGRRPVSSSLAHGQWHVEGGDQRVLAQLKAAAHRGRWHGGGRRVPARLQGGGARREEAAGELQLDSRAAARRWKWHGSYSNEGRRLRIRGVRRIDPDGNSALQAK